MPDMNPTKDAKEVWKRVEAAAQALANVTPPNQVKVLVDGSMFAPSDRAIDGVELYWVNANPEEWDEFYGELTDCYDRFDHNGWSLGWDEGVLWLYGPEYEEEVE